MIPQRVSLLIKDSGLDTSVNIEGFRDITLAINVDTREEVDTTINEVRNVGGTIVREPSDASWGGRGAMVTF